MAVTVLFGDGGEEGDCWVEEVEHRANRGVRVVEEARVRQFAVTIERIEFVGGNVSEDEGGDIIVVTTSIIRLDGVRRCIGDVESVIETLRDVREDLSDGILLRDDEWIVQLIFKAKADQGGGFFHCWCLGDTI